MRYFEYQLGYKLVIVLKASS